MTIKILHLNAFDVRGGAARAVYRIHSSFQKNAMKSEMLVAKKYSNDASVKEISISCLSKKKWVTRKLQKTSRNISFSSFNLFYSNICKEINKSDADIVHLHWIGNELISISEIKEIKKPIVWTLHDMWAFCGAEHYDNINNPGQYRFGYEEEKINLNAITWKRKKKYWQDINFNFVSPSHWLDKCLQESALFYQKKAKIIRNCLDVNQYRKIDRETARKKINLSTEKQVILFGADGRDSNYLKGFRLLIDSFKFISRDNFQFVVFGGGTGRRGETINGLEIIDIGKINDEDYLSSLYSAADVFVIPSMIDNYPNTVLEAMSCSTPCVGFKVGGIPEMIDHKVNGYLVEPFDTKQLAEGIAWVLYDKKRRDGLGENARVKIEKECNETKIAEEYKILYESILKNR